MQKGLIPLNERKIEPSKEKLVAVPSLNPNRPIYLAQPVADIAIRLVRDARAAGFKHPYFSIGSGYRTIEKQERLWANALRKYGDPEVADNYVARPGKSSHHTGFAFDVFLGHSFNSEDVAKIKKGEAYKFMRDHLGPKYGLTQLRSEPWHWECDRACRERYISATKPSKKLSVLPTIGIVVGIGFLVKYIRDKRK